MTNIDNNIWKELDIFFSTKTIQDVDRNTFLNCTLRDKINKISITLVFTKNYNVSDADTYNYVSIKPEGVVFTFPCYWVSVPKELAMPYFKYIISQFYDNEISTWTGGNSNPSTGNNTGSGTGSGCGCHTPCGITI